LATTPYAVANDVIAYCSTLSAPPAEPDLDRLILRACDLLDAHLIGTQYDVDANGNPTDVITVIPALKNAVCAQVEFWLSNGDELDEMRQWMVTTVEGVTLNRGNLRAPQLAPRAINHLRVAGLRTSQFPIHVP
jgi:hypothetical protein